MSESRSDLALAAAAQLAAPLAEMLLQEGVGYPRFANALKAVFLAAAEQVLAADGARVNDSSLSTLSGIHRKDVRAWREAGQPPARAKTLSPVMELYTRWASDAAYCDTHGKPRILERSGAAGSFEDLALSVSKDVHPHALLQELLRLGVVRRIQDEEGKDGKLELCTDAFVPKDGHAEMLQLLSDNVADHLATAAHNLRGEPPLLEQAVFADGLTAASTAALAELARGIWAQAFRDVVRAASQLHRQDADQPQADQRMRFGMYYYRGPAAESES